MSTLAKVFVVLNLVFAVIYLGITAALLSKQENWYHKHENLRVTHEKDMKDKGEQINGLQAEVTRLTAANQTDRSEINRLNAELKSENEKYQNEAKKYNDLNTELGKLREKYETLSKDLEEQRQGNVRLSAENDQLKANLDEAVKIKEQNIDDKMRLSKELEDAKMVLDNLEKAHVELAKRNQENENIIANYLAKLKIRIPQELVKAPAIAGRVIGVSDQYNLVMISVGDQDGVKEGYEFTISRGKEFVGRVKVDKVFPDMCAASALEEYQREKIQKGDEARTRVE